MKKISTLIIFILGVACATLASTNIDEKYLKGAVPEIDGKVVFEREIKINQSIPTKQLFELVQAWANETFISTSETKQRILLVDEAQNTLAIQAEDTLVFKTSFISIDRAILNYRLIIKVEHGKINLIFNNIKYDYQDFKGSEKAENLIVDKIAYNKKKNTLNKFYDKFRIFTIDAIDNNVELLKQYLSNVAIDKLDKANATKLQQTQQELSIVYEDKNTVSIVGIDNKNNGIDIAEVQRLENKDTNTVTSTVVKTKTHPNYDGYKLVKDANLIASYKTMITQSKLLLVDENGKTVLASWNGLNEMSGNDISMISINKDEANQVSNKYTISFINNSIYTDELKGLENGNVNNLSIKENAYSESWMIILCEKMMIVPATSNEDISIGWDSLNKVNKVLLMGKIEQIWVR